MDEYVRRADLLIEYDRQHVGPPGGARKIMETMPAVKVREDISAKWIVKTDNSRTTYGECSHCGMRQYAGHTKFCPDCGARMAK